MWTFLRDEKPVPPWEYTVFEIVILIPIKRVWRESGDDENLSQNRTPMKKHRRLTVNPTELCSTMSAFIVEPYISFIFGYIYMDYFIGYRESEDEIEEPLNIKSDYENISKCERRL